MAAGESSRQGDIERVCAVCNVSSSRACSRCGTVYYCGNEHQQQHWRVHRDNCRPCRVETNAAMGRHLVATKLINPGDVVLTERPIVMGPKVVSLAVCICCMQRVPDRGWVACPGCYWPLCSSECKYIDNHQTECNLMQSSDYHASFSSLQGKRSGAFCAIVPLRCLLMKMNDPDKYNSLISLESHLEERLQTRLYGIYRHNIAGFIRIALKQEQHDEETILKIAAILDTNAFEIRLRGIEGRGIYPSASMMAHDCTPNTKHFFKDDYSIKVIASLPIMPGDVITTSYTEPLWGTIARRSHLKERKCFDCTCRRCADPTEFGTYVGAILCSKCKESKDGPTDPENESKMISTAPLDAEAIWKCEQCPYVVPSSQITWGINVIKQALDNVDLTNAHALESFLEKYKTILHPKNSYILQAKHALCKIYGSGAGYELPELPEHLLKCKVMLCHELLNVANSIFPGLSTFRGKLLYDLQATMKVQAKRDLENNKISKMDFQAKLKDALNILQEAFGCLNHEPDTKRILKEEISKLTTQINAPE